MDNDGTDRPESRADSTHEAAPWCSLPLRINSLRALEVVQPSDTAQLLFVPVALLTDDALTEFYDDATRIFQCMMYRFHAAHSRGRARAPEEERDNQHSLAPWSSLSPPIETLRGLGLVQPRGTIRTRFVPVDLLTNNAIRELYDEMARNLQRTMDQVGFFLSYGRYMTREEEQDILYTSMQSLYEAFGYTGDFTGAFD